MKNIKELKNEVETTERIIQFGEGNFLRAFVDWIVNTMNKEVGFNSKVVVVQPIASGLINMINDQDGLYTLYLNGLKNGEVVSEHEIIESISRGINPYERYSDFLDLAKNPDFRFIISNTTEAGISFDENDKLDSSPQNSYPGKLTALLYKRFQIYKGDNNKGFIIIPCELIDRNGDKLKDIILDYAKLWNLETEFIDWINNSNTFCNSLVDRIVPGYPKDRINDIVKELGYEDKLVDEAEQFHLWVIEAPQWIKKEFPADKAGLNVLFVDDMTPYRTRKVRILNGSHTSMVPVSYLYGIDTVKETIEDGVMGKFVKDVMFKEIIPTLDLPASELEQFANDVLDRFRNPYIKHYLISISLNSMSKYKTRVLPSLLEYVNRKGVLPKKLVFSLAALIIFYKGDRNGTNIQIKDDKDILDMYKILWNECDGSIEKYEKIVEAVLGYTKLWNTDLNQVIGLKNLVVKYIYSIEKNGIAEAIHKVI